MVEHLPASLPINPGRVAWTGDNSSMYLSAGPGADYTTLASDFRIARSLHGPGRVLVLIVHQGASRVPLRLCLFDNRALAEWLVADFACHFQQLKGRPEVRELRFLRLDEHGEAISADGRQARFAAAGVDLELYWRRAGESFFVALPAEASATGRHQMFSVFVDIEEAGGTANGEPLPGRVQPRVYQGRRSTTAFLALSETWVAPP